MSEAQEISGARVTVAKERCRFDALTVGEHFAHKRSGRVMQKRRDGSGFYAACIVSGARFFFQARDMVYPADVEPVT